MRKSLIFSLIIILVSFKDGICQSYSLGGAIIYGNDIEEFGGHARAYYNAKNNKICFGPEFSQFAKKSIIIGNDVIKERLREINFNLHYVFELSESWGFYPLIGFNASFAKEEITNSSGHSETHIKSFYGSNLGTGFHKKVNHWMFFVEFDRLFSDASQSSFLIGAFFTFGKQSEHE